MNLLTDTGLDLIKLILSLVIHYLDISFSQVTEYQRHGLQMDSSTEVYHRAEEPDGEACDRTIPSVLTGNSRNLIFITYFCFMLCSIHSFFLFSFFPSFPLLFSICRSYFIYLLANFPALLGIL
jgi:hypothetical protein